MSANWARARVKSGVACAGANHPDCESDSSVYDAGSSKGEIFACRIEVASGIFLCDILLPLTKICEVLQASGTETK